MRRRDFLATALAAPLAAEPRIRIAFLGTNHSHGKAKLELVRQHPAFELVGVCQPGLENPGIRLLSREAVLEDRSIQAIMVDSLVPAHSADGRAALEAGKHTHIEKPPSHDLAGLRVQ